VAALRAELDAKLEGLIGQTRRGARPLVPDRQGPTELWLRKPWLFSAQLIRDPFPRFVLSHGDLRELGATSPFQLLAELMPDTDWTYIIVGANSAQRYTHASGPDTAVARFPVWRHGANPEKLVRYARVANESSWERVLVSPWVRGARALDTPNPRITANKATLWLYEVSRAFPQVLFHLHGGSSFRSAFGLHFGAADLNPVTKYSNDHSDDPKLMLPNGRRVPFSQARKNLKWLHAVGFSVEDVRTEAGRIALAVASAQWAAENYADSARLGAEADGRPDPLDLRKAARGRVSTVDPADAGVTQLVMRAPRLEVDPFPQMVGVAPDSEPEPYECLEPVAGGELIEVAEAPERFAYADKIVCDSCSLADTCRYVRAGGVCIVPSSDMTKIVELFGTRDAVQLREALGAVLTRQATRYDKIAQAWDEDVAAIAERPTKETVARSKHLMELETSLSRGTEALIKILDPSQRTPAVGVNVTVPALQQNTHIYNPAALVADVVRRLEQAGIDRAAITPAMVADVMREQGEQAGPKMIEGEVF
jgi:hypothetical protein